MEISEKNTYLEHAAKIIRHDMHSGINTYIPRGLSSLERRLKPEDIEKLKIEAPMKMIKEDGTGVVSSAHRFISQNIFTIIVIFS